MIRFFKKLLGLHEWKRICYGYPAGSPHWVDVEKCTITGAMRVVTDDLFAPRRPPEYLAHKAYMVIDDYVTESDFNAALSRLSRKFNRVQVLAWQ